MVAVRGYKKYKSHGCLTKPTLNKNILLIALLMAVRQNERGSYDSDQGLQYSSKDWQKFRQKYNLVPSMSRHLVQYTAR